MSTVKEIREQTGMSRADFSRVYNIPVRTLEDWEAERRKCPDYVLKLLQRVVNTDTQSPIRFKLYENPELMKELGSCYNELLKVMNSSHPHNPYPNAEITPTKYFTMLLPRAMSCGIPESLNRRIAQLMDFVDPEDWDKSMDTPCPPQARLQFLIGMTLK